MREQRTALRFRVPGRPAPQGSKGFGPQGQLREQSRYLPAWRAAVKRAVYEQYKEAGVDPADLPLFRGAVVFGGTFWLDTGQRIDSPPDLDKLIRATWDGLKDARVYEDDGRIVDIGRCRKRQAPDGNTGADIWVRPTRIRRQ